MSVSWPVASCVALACSVFAACDEPRIQVEFYTVDGHEFSLWQRACITLIAEAAEREVRSRLPQLPEHLTLRVQAGQPFEVDEHTGDNTAVLGPNAVMWTVDPRHMGSVIGVAYRELRVSLFHEWHHMLRDSAVAQRSMLDRAVREGLALVFERDCAHSLNPRARYDHKAAEWVDELRHAPDDMTMDEWMERYAQGRRYVVARAGTYLVDRALNASGKSASQLATTPTAAIIELASGIADPPATR